MTRVRTHVFAFLLVLVCALCAFALAEVGDHPRATKGTLRADAQKTVDHRGNVRLPSADEQTISTPINMADVTALLHTWSKPVPSAPLEPLVLAHIYSHRPAVERAFVYFLHIPKTAGQAFHSVLSGYFANNEVILAKKRHWVESTDHGGKPPNNLAFYRNQKSPECDASPLCKMRPNQQIAPRFDFAFAAGRLSEPCKGHPDATRAFLNPWDIAVGHTDISVLHTLLPRQSYVVTFVREPVARFYSLYNFLQTQSIGLHECMRAHREGHLEDIIQTRLAARGDKPRPLGAAAARARAGGAHKLEGGARRLFAHQDEKWEGVEEKWEGAEGYDTDPYGELAEVLFKSGNHSEKWEGGSNSSSSSARRLLQTHGTCNPAQGRLILRLNIKSPEALYELKMRDIQQGRERKMIGLGSLPFDWPLQDFFNLVTAVDQHNYMTKAFSGGLTFNVWGNPASMAPDLMLETALEAVDRFAFVGDTARYDESVDLFVFRFGLPLEGGSVRDRLKLKRNVSRAKVAQSDEIDKLVRAANTMDTIVHAAGVARFRRDLEGMARYKEQGRTPDISLVGQE